MPIRLIGRGFAGWHAKGWTRLNETFSSTFGTLEAYQREADDGCPVYDARHLDGTPAGDAFLRWALSGDAVRLDVLRGVPGYEPTGWQCDYRDVEAHCAALRDAVPGLKWGRVKAGRVCWDT